MNKQENKKKENKVKGLFLRFVEKIDKKMQEKARRSKGCCSSDDSEGNSCCS